LRNSDCGLMRAMLSSIRIPQSTIRNRHTRPLPQAVLTHRN